MATYNGLPSVRDDFRCSLCRQKNTFHCEHDTPYRDQLLGTYDADKPYIATTNSRRTSQRISSHSSNQNTHNHSAKNDGIQNGHHGKNTNLATDTRYQQGNRSNKDPVVVTDANGSMRPHGQKKKTKSCVIL